MGQTELISAADVEKFGYCPLSWWLSRGLAPEDEGPLVEGERRHEEAAADLKGIEVHEIRASEAETGVMYFAIAATIVAIMGFAFVVGTGVEASRLLSVVALIWLLASVFFLYRAETLATPEERHLSERVIVVCAMAASVVAFAAVYFPGIQNTSLAQGLEAIALGWLIGASAFLYRSLLAMETARATRRRYGVDGQVAYVDSPTEKPKLFVSTKHGLSGRPDLVVVEGEHHIPVEIKTGRIPRGPLFSHILQVAAYCLLMEEEYGKAPPYGILRYGNQSHEIDYSEDLKKLLLAKLKEIRASLAKGEAHRNHSRPGKCAGCSRRAVCPERLA